MIDKVIIFFSNLNQKYIPIAKLIKFAHFRRHKTRFNGRIFDDGSL